MVKIGASLAISHGRENAHGRGRVLPIELRHQSVPEFGPKRDIAPPAGSNVFDDRLVLHGLSGVWGEPEKGSPHPSSNRAVRAGLREDFLIEKGQIEGQHTKPP
jgi:hypothetical protein